MEVIEREAYRGYTIEIAPDDYPCDPRDPQYGYDHAGTMVMFHRRYRLGDEHKHSFRSPDEFREYMETEQGLIVLPVYMYDHGGITISTSPYGDRWDSGQVGWIYMTADDAKAEGLDRESAVKRLEAEVESYDQYLRGDCYMVVIRDGRGRIVDGPYGGLYGMDDCMETGRDMIDSIIVHHAREAERLTALSEELCYAGI